MFIDLAEFPPRNISNEEILDDTESTSENSEE